MKGDKGTCSSDKTGAAVMRTRYETEKDAENSLKSHIEMLVANPIDVVYKCKLCKMWHFGKQEYKQKFGI